MDGDLRALERAAASDPSPERLARLELARIRAGFRNPATQPKVGDMWTFSHDPGPPCCSQHEFRYLTRPWTPGAHENEYKERLREFSLIVRSITPSSRGGQRPGRVKVVIRHQHSSWPRPTFFDRFFRSSVGSIFCKLQRLGEKGKGGSSHGKDLCISLCHWPKLVQRMELTGVDQWAEDTQGELVYTAPLEGTDLTQPWTTNHGFWTIKHPTLPYPHKPGYHIYPTQEQAEQALLATRRQNGKPVEMI